VDETQYLLAVTLVAAATTWGLRALPFAVLAPIRSSALLPYLAERMPVGIMAILAIYTLRNVKLLEPGSVVPAAVGVVLTAAIHLWRGSMLLSVGVGTAAYVLLVSLVFT